MWLSPNSGAGKKRPGRRSSGASAIVRQALSVASNRAFPPCRYTPPDVGPRGLILDTRYRWRQGPAPAARSLFPPCRSIASEGLYAGSVSTGRVSTGRVFADGRPSTGSSGIRTFSQPGGVVASLVGGARQRCAGATPTLGSSFP
jgi:hypothetical protein